MVGCETEFRSLQGRNVSVQWSYEYGMKHAWSSSNLDSWKIFFSSILSLILEIKLFLFIADAFSCSFLDLFELEVSHGLSHRSGGNTVLGLQQRRIFWPDLSVSFYKAFCCKKRHFQWCDQFFVLLCYIMPCETLLIGGANLWKWEAFM